MYVMRDIWYLFVFIYTNVKSVATVARFFLLLFIGLIVGIIVGLLIKILLAPILNDTRSCA